MRGRTSPPPRLATHRSPRSGRQPHVIDSVSHTMRVLVVEDEGPLGEVFRDFLAEMGHDPIVVQTAEAALGSLERQRPDAIILDINLPGMSGLDFLQLRPVREAALPIVAISGVATEGQARECLRLGALDFVGKPVPLERLNEVLTFLEPHALTRRRVGSGQHERRRGPRAQIGFPVRIVEYKGTAWDGVCTSPEPRQRVDAGKKLDKLESRLPPAIVRGRRAMAARRALIARAAWQGKCSLLRV